MNILIATHGKLALGFLDALNILFGEKQNVFAVVLNEQGIEHFKVEFDGTMAKCHQTTSGTLIFVDIFGGTPWNVAAGKIKPKYTNVEIIAGINLPLLLAAIELSDSGLSVQEIAQQVMDFSLDSVKKYQFLNKSDDGDE